MGLQNDVEMPIPKYFIIERAKALKEREKLLSQILSRLGAQERDAVSSDFILPDCCGTNATVARHTADENAENAQQLQYSSSAVTDPFLNSVLSHPWLLTAVTVLSHCILSETLYIAFSLNVRLCAHACVCNEIRSRCKEAGFRCDGSHWWVKSKNVKIVPVTLTYKMRPMFTEHEISIGTARFRLALGIDGLLVA